MVVPIPLLHAVYKDLGLPIPRVKSNGRQNSHTLTRRIERLEKQVAEPFEALTGDHTMTASQVIRGLMPRPH
jgi:hypothetical protein